VYQDTEARARRRAEITRLLARYPHLDEPARHELTDWFAREASSLDVAMLSCDEGVAEQYRQFRAEHINPLRARDWLRGLGFVVVIPAIMALLFWRAF